MAAPTSRSPPALHGREHRRVPSFPRLPQARRPPGRARRSNWSRWRPDGSRHHRARKELGAVEAFLAEVEQGPHRARLSGEAGIGKTILWEKGVDEGARRFGHVLTCRGVEAEASLSFAGLSELLTPVLEEACRSLLRRGGGRSRSRCCWSSRVNNRRIRTRSGWRCSTCSAPWPSVAHCSSHSTMHSGSTPPPPARSRLRFVACATSRSACWPRSGLAQSSRVPFDLDRSFPTSGSSGSRLARSAWAGAQLARGATRPRADASRARPRAGGDGRQPVLRARARPRARSHGHEAGAGPGAARTGEPARAARRPARPAAGRDARRPASRRCARAPDGRAGGGGARRPGARSRALEAAVRRAWSSSTSSHVRFAHPVARVDLLRAGAGLEASRGAPGTGRRGDDVEERARHLALAADGPDAAVAAELDAAAEQRCRPRRDGGRGRALRAGGRADAGRSRARHAVAALPGGEPPPPGRQPASERSRCSSSFSTRFRPGAERADILLELVSTVQADATPRDRAVRRGARRGRRRRRPLGADPGLPNLDATFCRATCRRRSPTPERRSRRPSGSVIPLLLATVIARAGRRDVGRRDHSRPARAGRGDRGAARARSSSTARARAFSPAADAPRRARPGARAARGAGGGRGSTRGRRTPRA